MESRFNWLSRFSTLCVFLIATTLAPPNVDAQDSGKAYSLYAGLIKSKGYVVGSPLSQSGLHRLNSYLT